METITKIKGKLNNKNITKIIMIFILLQPILDILSFLDIRNLIPFGISTYVKPLLVFGVGVLIYFLDKDARKKWTILYALYGLLIIGHLFLLNGISTELSVMLHELRFMINIAYMLVLYMIFDYMYLRNENKEEFIVRLKKTLVVTFMIYGVMILTSILTGTSGRTYEYSDPLKLGFKGWLDSGQIFGHALCIVLPFMMFYILNYKNDNKIIQLLVKLTILIPIIILCLIGTKVTLFMCIIVIASYILLSIFFSIKDRSKKHITNILLCAVVLVIIFATYTKLPTYHNMTLQRSVDEGYSSVTVDKNADIDWENLYSELRVEEISTSVENYDERAMYNEYHRYAIQKLKEKYIDGSVIPSDIRSKQLVYNFNKFKVADIEYKVFGLGYLNQSDDFSIERDILMSIFSFGILGFITMFIVPIILMLKATYLILRKIKHLDFETLVLYEGIAAFFFISFYAGYTFIYTNFSIFLVALMCLLNHNLKTKLKNTE